MDYLFVRKFWEGRVWDESSIMNNNILMERQGQFSVRIVQVLMYIYLNVYAYKLCAY